MPVPIAAAACRTGMTGVLLVVAACLAGCETLPPPTPKTAVTPPLPAPVAQTTPPAPAASTTLPAEDLPRYTVTVNDVPVRELLFSLARDAQFDLDVRGDLAGNVTLNAVEQTIPAILARINAQVPLRIEREAGAFVVMPDEPFVRTYRVDYVNLARDTDTTANIATEVATTGDGSVAGGGRGSVQGANGSATRVSAKASHHFWETLAASLESLLKADGEAGAPKSAAPLIVPNAEAGLLSVRATARQHALTRTYLDEVLTNARRQVLVEATVVEVSLDEAHQAGIDWRLVLAQTAAGVSATQTLAGAAAALAGPTLVLGYHDPDASGRLVDATLQLLQTFGSAKVLSSPRLMVLNNQTALLKVVEELVYFTVGVTNTDTTANARGRTFVQSDVHSVPVGLVMAVTPQISAEGEITLTVRPTISQKVGDAVDPGPRLAAALNGGQGGDISNLVPVIRTRELESVLKLINGQVGVLGGLMQDEQRTARREVPGLSELPGVGALFQANERTHHKTELVVFLRPVIVAAPNATAALQAFTGEPR